jgi:hypothetical protein
LLQNIGGVDEPYIQNIFQSAIVQIKIPTKLAATIIDKELIEAIEDYKVLITKDLSFWNNLIKKKHYTLFCFYAGKRWRFF